MGCSVPYCEKSCVHRVLKIVFISCCLEIWGQWSIFWAFSLCFFYQYAKLPCTLPCWKIESKTVQLLQLLSRSRSKQPILVPTQTLTMHFQGQHLGGVVWGGHIFGIRYTAVEPVMVRSSVGDSQDKTLLGLLDRSSRKAPISVPGWIPRTPGLLKRNTRRKTD